MLPSKKLAASINRLDKTKLEIKNDHGVPVTLFANEQIPIENEAISQALGFVSIAQTIDDLWQKQKSNTISPFWGDVAGSLQKVVLTPDFHRGSGIPVGTVAQTSHFIIPQAVGNDVCCGMRLLMTDISASEIEPHLDTLARPLRDVFFGGKREIPMAPMQREALLREGLPGLLAHHRVNGSAGTWQYYDAPSQEQDLLRVHMQGGRSTRGTFAFDDYIRASGASDGRDSQIGSIGGGNHFVELQVVDQVIDGSVAHQWGVQSNHVTIMAHSGSVGLGHAVGGYFADEALRIFPRSLRRPAHGFYVIPTTGPHAALAAKYLDAMHNAANFAFANRLFLGLMAVRVLSEVLGRKVNARLIYDAPHNLIWPQGSSTADQVYLHRKGACPAPGPSLAVNDDVHHASSDPFRYIGHPVIIPGSMGAASYLLQGQGNDSALCSACHGAGRILSRGKSRHVDADQYRDTFAKLRVVTPIDPTSAEVRTRRDVMAEYHSRLKEEAPYAYKDIGPVVETVEVAGVAKRVARMWPLLTVKG
jgi:tRNA-splicing ligase RtcB (3'-phosphate/5'-hydroxy nucleic acid ligase)